MHLRHRQVHLDFHTSPHIEGVGRDFEPNRFGDTLAAAGVDSINLFARCHHGHLYHQSAAFPERIHPHLARPNLLVDQIEACHARGIRAPIYTTVQWDQVTRDRHRDWLLIDRDGKPTGDGPMKAGFYDRLDVSHPGYVAFLQEHVAELFAQMPVDGLWFDIVVPVFSYDQRWLRRMAEEGLDPEDPLARTAFARGVIDRFKREMSRFVREQPGFTDDCTIFFNAGHVGPRHRATRDAYTHYEVESLASGEWGYLHFPTAQRAARELGKPVLGMTGKFHGSWGDFHGLKNEAALEFEVFQVLSLNGACSIGDQLHPHGRLDPATYKLIGSVYRSVEAKEPWCRDAVSVCDVAVMNPEEFGLTEGLWQDESRGRTDAGAVRMLTELALQFDLVTSDKDLGGYRLVVLPDEIPLGEGLAAKLDAFVAAGGSVIASHRSGLADDGERFAGPFAALTRVGEAAFEPDFLHPGPEMRAGLEDTRYVMSQRAIEVGAGDAVEVLAAVERPFFNRDWRHFCSHAYTPTSGEVVYPAITEQRPAGGGGGRALHFAHPIFRMYDHDAPRWAKRLFANAVSRCLPDPLVEHDGPSTLKVSLNRQPADAEAGRAEGRLVLHLLQYIPERRGRSFDVIEDVIPLHGLKLKVRVPRRPGSVRMVPEGEALESSFEGGELGFVLPLLRGHAVVEITQD